MRKLALGIGVLILLAMVLPAMAEPAVVSKDIDCNLLDETGASILATGQIVVTSSGNAELVCKYDFGPLEIQKAIRWDFETTELSCNTYLGGTEDWMEVITPSGQATLTCHFSTPPAS